ncbi:MAG: hypothetical protein FWF03_04470 [Defluviitaleaceae bacterium]|nr:hypothetical protein [Defluviitaleaceae bacterium]
MRVLLIGIEGQRGWHGAGDSHEFAFVDYFGEYENSEQQTKDWIAGRCETFGDASGAFDRFKPDFAAVNVPNFAKNDTALEIAIIERGIPLLISKLRLRAKSDFFETLGASKKRGASVYIGEFYRYDPRAATAKRVIDDGLIGTPEQVRYECGLPYGEVSPWELSYERLALEDLAFHHLSVLHYLIDITPKNAFAVSASPIKGGASRGSASSLVLATEGGCNVSHAIDWHNTMRETDFFGNITIDGSKGGISVEPGKVYAKVWGGERREVSVSGGGETTAPEKIMAGKLSEVWTIEQFKPVVDCIYAKTP